MIPLNSLFFQLSETSFRASLVIAALLLLRPWLRRAIGSQWFCVLWLLVLVRLLVPCSIQSPWSMGSLHSVVQRHEPTPKKSSNVITDTEQAMPAQWQTKLSQAESAERFAALSVEPVSKKSTIAMNIPGVVWVAGALASFAGLVWRMFQTRRLAARAYAVTDPQLLQVFRSIDLELRRNVELRMNDEVSVPTLVGLRRPQIWLPRSCMEQLTSEELRHVLLHELGHARRGDLLVHWLFLVAQCLHWFNPLIWIAGRLAKADREMACDAWVLARASDGSAAEYGLTLLKIVQLLRRPARTQAVVVEMATSKQDLTTRVRAISAFRHVAAWRGGMVALAAVSGLMLVTTRAQTPSAQENIVGESSPAHVEVGATTPVNADTPQSPTTVTPSDKGVRVELDCILFEAPQSVWRRLKVDQAVAGGTRNGELFAGNWPSEAAAISCIMPRSLGIAESNRLLKAPGVVAMKAEKREVAPGKSSIITFPAKDGWARALSIKPRVGPYYDAIDLDLTPQTQTQGPPMTTPVTIMSGQTVFLRSSASPVVDEVGKPAEVNEQLFVVTAKVLGKPSKAPLPRPPEPAQIQVESTFVELTDEAVQEFKLESLIYPSSTAAKESAAVIWDEQQTKDLMRALNQQRGVDQFGAPRVTTKSKQRALIEVIRELRDPEAWEKHPSKPGAWVVSSFETRNVGATLEVAPELKADGMLSLDFKPQIVEALGFVDLETGQPAPGQRRNKVRKSLSDIINAWPTFPNYEFVPGHRNNMVFSERSAHQKVTVKPRQSIVLVLKEQADIKPFEADAPKGHLIAIVTADVINNSGARRTAGTQ